MSSQLHVLSLQTQKHRCIATLKTLSPHISCLAVNGNLLYAAAINEITVFDLSDDNSLVDSFNDDPTSGFVKSIAFNSTNIFTAHQDGKIRVWQVSCSSKKHHLLSTLPTLKDKLLRVMLPKNYVNERRHKKKLWIQHWDSVSGLVVNEDGLMYSISWDKSLKIWNAKTQRCLESVKAHEDAVNTLVVSSNGTIYTGSADGLIRVWNRAEDKRKRHRLVATLDKHKSTVNALALNDEGSVLFSGGSDGTLIVWEKNIDNDDGVVGFVEALWGHSGAVLCLINIGDLFLSGSSDRTVRVWQRGMGFKFCCNGILEGHEKPVKSLVAIGRGRRGVFSICTGSLDGEVKLWEVDGNKLHDQIHILLDKSF